MKPDHDLWDRSEREWGSGGGYRDRVVAHHRRWFIPSEPQEMIEALIDRERREVLNRLSAMLSEV